MVFLILLAFQLSIIESQVLDYPTGSIMSGIEGSEVLDINHNGVILDGALDYDLKTYISLKQGESITVRCKVNPPLFIDRICFVNGDQSGKGRIKKISIESKRDKMNWIFILSDTTVYQEIKLPFAIWLKRNSEFTITPLESFEPDQYKISEISFYGE